MKVKDLKRCNNVRFADTDDATYCDSRIRTFYIDTAHRRAAIRVEHRDPNDPERVTYTREERHISITRGVDGGKRQTQPHCVPCSLSCDPGDAHDRFMAHGHYHSKNRSAVMRAWREATLPWWLREDVEQAKEDGGKVRTMHLITQGNVHDKENRRRIIPVAHVTGGPGTHSSPTTTIDVRESWWDGTCLCRYCLADVARFEWSTRPRTTIGLDTGDLPPTDRLILMQQARDYFERRHSPSNGPSPSRPRLDVDTHEPGLVQYLNPLPETVEFVQKVLNKAIATQRAETGTILVDSVAGFIEGQEYTFNGRPVRVESVLPHMSALVVTMLDGGPVPLDYEPDTPYTSIAGPDYSD